MAHVVDGLLVHERPHERARCERIADRLTRPRLKPPRTEAVKNDHLAATQDGPLRPLIVKILRLVIAVPQLAAVVGGVSVVAFFCLAVHYARILSGTDADTRQAYDRLRENLVTGGAFDFLHNVALPDGQGGSLHFDFLLLTARGCVILDMRNVVGHIFGGDQMNEWTVIAGARRSTFQNPQGALYDRVAAVKAVASRVISGGAAKYSEPNIVPSRPKPVMISS